jgi:ADP-heptose:LPS heptosyltransferase
MYEDLVPRGLSLRLLGGVKPRIRDRNQAYLSRSEPPRNTVMRRITYNRESIKRHGSILAAQFAAAGVRMPERPDFSLPVPYAWRSAALQRVGVHDRPIMVMRPSVLNDVWLSRARAPEPRTYARLYECLRDMFTVVTVANIGDKGEHFDGDQPRADVRFERGELQFEELAGLFANARLAFTCPGFSPVLSQAVGTPTVIVYGGNESFRTTNSVGAHLAPTLAIEPVNPCECHLKNHDCDKTVDETAAIKRIQHFVEREVLCAS